MNLYDQLRKYAETDALPMHMPGHKRNTGMCCFDNPFAWDITEIDGFDNLHEPEEILREGQQLASEIYGMKDSWYLINGSTAGILAGILACTNPGDRVLIARNCHKSVYHALILQQLVPVYLHPYVDETTGIAGSIDPLEVQKILEEQKNDASPIRLVVITSPTYEGILSDVHRIAEICHSCGIPLMVDEAHGAHLRTQSQPYSPFPESACACGADLVIQSLHKTLPSLTQTALMHQSGNLVDQSRVRFFLDIDQTSSPSYILMASIDQCLRRMKEESWQKVLTDWNQILQSFHQQTSDLQCLQIFAPEPSEHFFARDPSKLVITTAKTAHTGKELMNLLRSRYHIELEMASEKYVIAMTGAGDTEENLQRFTAAILAIDRLWAKEKTEGSALPISSAAAVREQLSCTPSEALRCSNMPENYEEVMFSKDLLGQVSLDFLFPYPPGIPVLVPGEVITEQVLQTVHEQEQMGLPVYGYRNPQKKTIRIRKS